MAGIIANGTYVLGDPNTRDLYIGNGLKQGITSDGKQYIAADETVLWEGDASFSCTLSESLLNFNEVDLYQKEESNIEIKRFSTDLISINKQIIICSSYLYTNSVVYSFGAMYSVSNDFKTLNAPNKGSGYSIQNGSFRFYTGNSLHGKICKVVGINRKEGN